MRWGLGAALCAACYSPVPLGQDASVDAAHDAPPAAPPVVVGSGHAHTADVVTLAYPITVPSDDSLLLLVAVQLGASDCTTAEPAVASVIYGDTVLSFVAAVQSLTCAGSSTRSELWQLASPAPGSDVLVVIDLNGSPLGSATDNSFHSGAVAVAGASAIGPNGSVVAGSASSESDASAVVSVPSQPDDLVVSFIGQGNTIIAADAPATELYEQDGGSATTLDNTAASFAPGTAGSSATALGWQFGGLADWQALTVAIHPP